MNNLGQKIFHLLIIILTTFLSSIFIAFNLSIYNKEYNDLKEKFMIINSTIQKNSYNPIFMENEVYVVIFNRTGNIDKIINYSSNDLTDSEIKELVINNVNKINSKKIESLYTSDYVFMETKEGNLIMVNNTSTKSYLLKELFKSILVFITLETIQVIISLNITKRIVKPVNEAFIRQKQFIYDASHELKTPIAIISASAEMLEKNPKEKKWLDNIKTENNRMNKLVISLLDLSKSENIKENEVYTSVNLSKVIKNKALTFESLIYENSLELDVDVVNDIMFNCNEDRIKELLSILMDNAIKHSLPNSQITVKLSKEKNNIYLSVKNKGKEIPISEREKIFERFYRLDKSRNRDDNRYGIGLSIAKNIVINHNGTINVNCKDGYTTFMVNFKQK